MTTLITHGLLLGGILAVTALAPGPLVAQQPAGIRSAGWLQGCWQLTSGNRVVEEQWMAPRGTSMLGMSRTVRDGRLVEFELMVLREEGDRLAYDARPSGQAAAVFLSQSIGDGMIVFENAEHDFPRTIGYRHNAPDELLAWIEGPLEGRTRRLEYPYRRVACAETK